jgi:hypothetical protein
MMENSMLNEKLFEAMLEAAICDDFQQELDKIDWSSKPAHIFSIDHIKRIKTILQRQKRVRSRHRLLSATKKVAVAILILISVSFIGLMSVDAVRSEVFRVVTEWYEKYVDVFFKSDDKNENQAAETANINLKDKGMMLPAFIPEGYVQRDITRGRSTIIVSASDKMEKNGDQKMYEKGGEK